MPLRASARTSPHPWPAPQHSCATDAPQPNAPCLSVCPPLLGDIEVYAAELADILQRKAASVVALQTRLMDFRKLMRSAMERQGDF